MMFTSPPPPHGLAPFAVCSNAKLWIRSVQDRFPSVDAWQQVRGRHRDVRNASIRITSRRGNPFWTSKIGFGQFFSEFCAYTRVWHFPSGPAAFRFSEDVEVPARGSFQPSQSSSQLCRFRDDQPAVDTLPIWPESDSPNVMIVFPRSGCSAARVPPDVLDALEEHLAPVMMGLPRQVPEPVVLRWSVTFMFPGWQLETGQDRTVVLQCLL